MKNLITIVFLSGMLHGLFAQDKAFKVQVSGEGAPILFLPGFSCTGAVWDETVALFSQTNECHVFTFAGFGDVPPIEKPWLSRIKDELLNYVKTQNLKNPIIVGHSMGGTLGLWMSVSEANLFEKLIVVDGLPSIGALMIPNFDASQITYNNPYSNNLLNMDESAFMEMAKQTASFMCFNKERQADIVNWIVNSHRKTYVDGYTDLLKLDLRPEMHKIKIPVTLLAATYPNKEMVKSNYDKQFKNVEDFTAYYADNSAHFIMYDQPEWFLSHLKTALSNSVE